MSDIPIIDAHQHFWDLERNHLPWLQDDPSISFRYGDYSAIRRTYMPAEYRRDAERHRVVKSVFVETEWDPADPAGEVRWVEEVAREHGLPNAVVAQAWLHRADVAEVLAGHAASPLVRGVRHKPAAAPSPDSVIPGAPGSMGDPQWRKGYALLATHGLSFDLQTPWWHLGEAAALARDFPGVPLILNHTGLPADRSGKGLGGWREALEELAGLPNTAIKISGLGVPGQAWSVESNRTIVLDAIAIFGAERAMFASNFPVDSLVATFDTLYGGFKAITGHLPRADRLRLFHDNALRWYRIEE